jgi:dTDP-4-amino-4,6-dideoxygalactose transaminase
MIDFMPPVSFRKYLCPSKAADNRLCQNTWLTLRGRDSIALASEHIRLEAHDVVLLPGYLCDTVTAVFAGKCKLAYYDINQDFSIDVGVIERFLREYKVRVLYIVHYFGFLHPNLSDLRRLCDTYGVLLWEDHAHSALSNWRCEFADAMIFSFRKVFPVPDGGGLRLRDIAAEGGVAGMQVTSDALAVLMLAKRYLWSASAHLRSVAHQYAQRQVRLLYQGRKMVKVRPISRMSARVVRHADIERIRLVRRQLFHEWEQQVADTRFEPVFKSVPAEVCPQGVPIWIANADEVVRHLESRKIFLKVHWPLPEYVKTVCPVSWRMSKSIVTLPLYPGLSHEDIGEIIRLVVRFGEPAAGPSLLE